MDEMAERPLHASVLISHTHWDHIQGLPFFRPAYGSKNRVRILGALGTRERLRTALGKQMDPMQFPVALESLAGICAIDEFNAPTITIGSFTVHTIELNHPGGCTGFRVAAAGKSVAYLPDHESYRSATHSRRHPLPGGESGTDEELVQFLKGCEVLILDSQYDRTEYPSHIGWGHGCLDDSVALALRAEVDQLVLFHHDPNHDDAKLDAMVNEARRQIAEAGVVLRVRAAPRAGTADTGGRARSVSLPNEKAPVQSDRMSLKRFFLFGGVAMSCFLALISIRSSSARSAQSFAQLRAWTPLPGPAAAPRPIPIWSPWRSIPIRLSSTPDSTPTNSVGLTTNNSIEACALPLMSHARPSEVYAVFSPASHRGRYRDKKLSSGATSSRLPPVASQ